MRDKSQFLKFDGIVYRRNSAWNLHKSLIIDDSKYPKSKYSSIPACIFFDSIVIKRQTFIAHWWQIKLGESGHNWNKNWVKNDENVSMFTGMMLVISLNWWICTRHAEVYRIIWCAIALARSPSLLESTVVLELFVAHLIFPSLPVLLLYVSERWEPNLAFHTHTQTNSNRITFVRNKYMRFVCIWKLFWLEGREVDLWFESVSA